MTDGLDNHTATTQRATPGASPGRAETPGAKPPEPLVGRVTAALHRLETQILRSYAHNSLLYSALEHIADLETITHFMRWDGAQPPFFQYLQQWLPTTPECIRPELQRHIAVEVDERHSELFKAMLAHLDSLVATPTHFDERRLAELNYTFSSQCASERDIGFFLGGFWATEIMSARRCAQIYRGLRRLGIDDRPLTYFRIHFECDEAHGEEVRERLIAPVLVDHPLLVESIEQGVHDRLVRSSAYLMWYEIHRLPQAAAEQGSLR